MATRCLEWHFEKKLAADYLPRYSNFNDFNHKRKSN